MVNVPPRGLGKTSLDHLARAARELGMPLLAMARKATAVPGLKDKAARALDDFARLIDELAALRDHTAEEVIRQLLALTGLPRIPGGRRQGQAARTGWRTSTS